MKADRGSEFGCRLFLVLLAIGWLTVGTDAPEQGLEIESPEDVAYSISDSPFWTIGSQRAATLGTPERDALGPNGDPPGVSPLLSSAFRESDSAPAFLRYTPSRMPGPGGGIAPARAPPS